METTKKQYEKPQIVYQEQMEAMANVNCYDQSGKNPLLNS